MQKVWVPKDNVHEETLIGSKRLFVEVVETSTSDMREPSMSVALDIDNPRCLLLMARI